MRCAAGGSAPDLPSPISRPCGEGAGQHPVAAVLEASDPAETASVLEQLGLPSGAMRLGPIQRRLGGPGVDLESLRGARSVVRKHQAIAVAGAVARHGHHRWQAEKRLSGVTEGYSATLTSPVSGAGAPNRRASGERAPGAPGFGKSLRSLWQVATNCISFEKNLPQLRRPHWTMSTSDHNARY